MSEKSGGGEFIEHHVISEKFGDQPHIGRKGADGVRAASFAAEIVEKRRDAVTQNAVARQRVFALDGEQGQLFDRHGLSFGDCRF